MCAFRQVLCAPEGSVKLAGFDCAIDRAISTPLARVGPLEATSPQILFPANPCSPACTAAPYGRSA